MDSTLTLRQYHRLTDFKHTERLLARFWQHVSKTDGCWLWTGTSDRHGYGVLSVRLVSGGRGRVYTHRLALMIEGDELKGDILACHQCDNPACVRVHPDHVYRGTYSTNSLDKHRHGRAVKNFKTGESSKGHKLTDEKVREIRRRHAQGETYSAMARHFRVSAPTVRGVVLGIDWAHVR